MSSKQTKLRGRDFEAEAKEFIRRFEEDFAAEILAAEGSDLNPGVKDNEVTPQQSSFLANVALRPRSDADPRSVAAATAAAVRTEVKYTRECIRKMVDVEPGAAEAGKPQPGSSGGSGSGCSGGGNKRKVGDIDPKLPAKTEFRRMDVEVESNLQG